MHLLLATYILVILAGLLFPGALGLGGGVSVENAVLAAIVGILVYRFVLARRSDPAPGGVITPFACYFAYALVSWIVAAGLIKYEGYDSKAALTILIGGLLAQLLVFTAFLLGPRNQREAYGLLKLLLIAVVLANLVTVLASLGVVPELVTFREDGRSEGVMGQANQHGIFAAIFLPALVVQAFTEHGLKRLIWAGGALATMTAMFIVASRGAFVGLFLGGLAGMTVLRKEVSIRNLVMPAGAAVVIATITILLLSLKFGDYFQERFIDDSTGSDMGDVSSGRVEFWVDALARMMRAPLSLITGFGWQVYWSLPHVKSPHNTYLSLWFNLGIPGLVCFVLIFVAFLRRVLGLLPLRTGRLRLHMMASVVGVLSLLAWFFFGELYTPWPFIWSYLALVLNLAASTENEEATAPRRQSVVKGAAAGPAAAQLDRFGWTVGGKGRDD